MALSDNLVSYWSLDEASGNALDAHDSNDLAETSGTIDSATGKVGNARDFEADHTEHFEIADNASLSTGDVDFTWQAWVKLESKATSYNLNVILSKWAVSNPQCEYALYYDASVDRFKFHVRGSTDGIALANTLGSPATDTWYLIHGWHDSVSNEVGIAVNAGSPDTVSFSAGPNNGSSALWFGALAEWDLHHFDGLIDEVGFWKRVLTSEERTELYNSGSGRDYAYITGGGGGGFNAAWVYRRSQVIGGGVL